MNSFIDLAKKRFSSRKYSSRLIEEDKLMQVLEAGRIAPSAANFQPWIFVVVKGEEAKNNFKTLYNKEWFKDAPVFIIICGDHNSSWKRADGKDHCDIDVAIAVDHMTLAAIDIGLATCWICNFDVKKCSDLLRLPSNLEPIAILPLAYPEDHPDTDRHITKRKALTEIVHYDFFNPNKD